mgnify:CR=1 FL=1
MCKQSDRAPSGTPSPRRSVGGGGLMDESSLANTSTIQRRSTREDCAGMDGWTEKKTRQSTTVHDSSLEVSGAGSRGDRPTASTARSRRPTASRPPDRPTALDRPRPPSTESSGRRARSRARSARRTNGPTDGPTDGTERTDRTNRPNGPNALSRAFVRAFLRPRRARERERDLRFERRSFARSFIHSFIHSSSGDERASAREG